MCLGSRHCVSKCVGRGGGGGGWLCTGQKEAALLLGHKSFSWHLHAPFLSFSQMDLEKDKLVSP